MPTPDPTRAALKAIRERHCPDSIRGVYYEPPQPLVPHLPDELLKGAHKDKDLQELKDAYSGLAQHDRLLAQAKAALDDAESDDRDGDAFRAKQAQVAARLARGDADASDVDNLLPAYTDDEMLARCDTYAAAVGEARKNIAAAVARCDEAIRTAAPSLIPPAVTLADRLDQEAAAAEAVAASARAKANAAKQVTRDLYLPAAMSAVRAAGIGPGGGYTVRDRARMLRALALVSPLEGWSTDAKDYPDQYAEAARHLGVTPVPKATMTKAQYAALSRMAAAKGEPAPAKPEAFL